MKVGLTGSLFGACFKSAKVFPGGGGWETGCWMFDGKARCSAGAVHFDDNVVCICVRSD